jgi:hypothetical protein
MLSTSRRLALRATLGGREAQTRSAKAANEIAAVHLDRTGLDHLGPILLGNVVVISLEPTPRDPLALGERVQFIERCIAHQVTPATFAEPPSGLIDEDHRPGCPAGAIASAAHPARAYPDRDRFAALGSMSRNHHAAQNRTERRDDGAGDGDGG